MKAKTFLDLLKTYQTMTVDEAVGIVDDSLSYSDLVFHIAAQKLADALKVQR